MMNKEITHNTASRQTMDRKITINILLWKPTHLSAPQYTH